jgi:hypothetical protein
MNLPYRVIFENDKSAVHKLIAQPMFLVDSVVEDHNHAPEACDASERFGRAGELRQVFRVNEENWDPR